MEHQASLELIYKARHAVRRNLKDTQLLRYESLSALVGADVYVKHENHQPGGSVKVRGAVHLAWELRRNGIQRMVCAGLGSEAVALATAGHLFSMECEVFLPDTAPASYRQRLVEAGATLRSGGFTAAECLLAARQRELSGAGYFVHPAEEPLWLNGVATCLLDIVEELPETDAIIASAGHGMTLAAFVCALEGLSLRPALMAVQARRAPALYMSWRAGQVVNAQSETAHRDLAVEQVHAYPLTWLKRGLQEFMVLSESQLLQGIALAAHHCRALVDGAGAAPLMAALDLRESLQGKTVVLLMNQGIVDEDLAREALAHPVYRSGVPDL